jgi:replicative DNA helicase
MNIEQAMPHALGVEKALLSIMLRDNIHQYPRFVDAGMSSDMFYLPSHVKLMSIIIDYTSKNKEIEMIGLIQELMDKNVLDELGGPAAITELFSYAPTDSQFDSFCETLKSKYIARKVIDTSYELQRAELTTLQDVQQVLSTTEAKLSELNSLMHPKSSSSVAGAIESVMMKFQEIVTSDNPKSIFGLPTGFSRMDSLTLGLKPQEVTIIGARPSVGKSGILFNMANKVCVEDKNPMLIFSCEMSKESVISRMIYSIARLPFHKMTARDGPRYIPSKSELIRMKESVIKMKEAPLYIEDKGGITIEDLKATARRHKRQYGIKVIGIDYLQLIRCFSKSAQNSKNAEITEISAGLKALAKELDLPIVCLSQLNRNATKGKPRMSDLRDSGSIEQDADMIGLLHRYDYEGATERKGEAEINITKNRNGPTGVIELEWNAEITQFTERVTSEP